MIFRHETDCANVGINRYIPVLNEYIRRHGRAPTLDELCKMFGVASKNTVSMMAIHGCKNIF
jgi:hypothetical protein